MKRSQAKTHRSHYIPEFVLRTFSDANDRIWCTYTDGRWGEPLLVSCQKVFVKKDLYTVREESGMTDRNERILAKKEDRWALALKQIRELLSQGRDRQITEMNAINALEYYLYALIRTPEHLRWVMYGGDHKPRDVIDKVFTGRRAEADYRVLEHNIRADLGSGQAGRVNSRINELTRTLGLGICKVKPNTGSFIIGSYGSARFQMDIWERSFVPVAPDMALFSTISPECLEVTVLDGNVGQETLRMMNTATWKSSQQVAATSGDLLESVRKQAGATSL